MSKDASILIVGAGTFGLSTTLELASNGYKNITVLERAAAIPSPYSAGCDLNKVIRAEYEDPFYTEIALDAIKAWKSPLFRPYYVNNGLLMANSPAADQQEFDSTDQEFASIEHHPAYPPGTLKKIYSSADVRAVVPQLTGPMSGWTGYFNKNGGYVRAGRAMAKMYEICKGLGVRFILGEEEGNAAELLFEDDSRKRCVGVKTKVGKEYKAAHTIVCLGAHVTRLLPSIAPQITAKAWAVAHIQLTPEQARSMTGIPVINCGDMGFFFEPDSETNLIKLCAHNAGLTNYEGGGRVSRPTSSGSEAGYVVDHGRIPRDDEEKIKKLIAETMPQFSSLPLIRKFICWCGDTTDSNFIIDYAPGTTDKSLLIFSGDSGHAFKMLPIAGRWARDVLEQGKQRLDRWKWKDVPVGDADDIHWRPGSLRDVKDIKDWVKEGDRLRSKL
ncbi:hypothetical protein MPDQ_006798 [Monascus purpureus]|uniref:FAD dependent oxidoreductase domain-containing protein n=1 Tax=Monascus purpureus TaxID=5098 RepID=A0A507QXW9_MONPU|nr:hypothetical protein MPDQ_006798 [Monascus purpureus]BDD57750.1 hypothetical protein MAP00_003094 [Monascus purpureus]